MLTEGVSRELIALCGTIILAGGNVLAAWFNNKGKAQSGGSGPAAVPRSLWWPALSVVGAAIFGGAIGYWLVPRSEPDSVLRSSALAFYDFKGGNLEHWSVATSDTPGATIAPETTAAIGNDLQQRCGQALWDYQRVQRDPFCRKGAHHNGGAGGQTG